MQCLPEPERLSFYGDRKQSIPTAGSGRRQGRRLAQRCADCGPSRSGQRAGGLGRDAAPAGALTPRAEGPSLSVLRSLDSAPLLPARGSDSRSSRAKPISDPPRWETHSASGGPVRMSQGGEVEAKTTVLGHGPF